MGPLALALTPVVDLACPRGRELLSTRWAKSVYINTDLIFGLFTLLGFRFAPRLRDLSDQTLYRARKGVDYGVLTPTLKKDIKVHLIMEHWDDLNRLAASLKDGLIRPSILISKLQAMQQHNPLQQALQELGRIAKTLHILEYVDDPAFRRRVLIGLNKGEHLHSLARDIAFGRQGRFHDRGYEAQLNRASALSLVINAIAVWNRTLGRSFPFGECLLVGYSVLLNGLDSLWGCG